MPPNHNDLWIVVEYEIEMFIGTSKLLTGDKPEFNSISIARNAVIESRLLHTRILVDFLLDRAKMQDDITLSKLLGDLEPSTELKKSIKELKSSYGSNQQEKSPCWTLNKILAHPTTWRKDSYDWGSTLNQIDPHLYRILELLADLSGRDTLRSLLSLH